MDNENTYHLTYDQSTPIGDNWPRVSSRVAFEDPPYMGSRGAAARDWHREPAPLADDNHPRWNAPAPERGIEDLQQAFQRLQSERATDREDAMQRVQAEYQNYAGANDFDMSSTQIPAPSNDPDTDSRKSYDPTVPSYAQPHFQPDEPPADSRVLITLDEARGRPEREAIRLERDEENHRGMAENAYPFVYADEPFFQLPQSNLIVNPVPHYLSIDSRDRDRNTWPNSNHFRIPLVTGDASPEVLTPGVRYKNIYSITLLSAVIPNVTGILDEPYVLLQIDEINDVYDSANPHCAKSFVKLFFKEVFVSSAYLRLDKGVGDPLVKVYWPAPRASLESITVSFRRYDGTLIDFGDDAPPESDPLGDRQTAFTLEIRTFVADVGKALGHRNP